jgi:hypothetical protein
MSREARTVGARRPVAAAAAFVVTAGLIAGGCSSSGSTSSSSTLACPSKPGTAVTGTAPAATGRPAAGWTLPDADIQDHGIVRGPVALARRAARAVAWPVLVSP